MEKEFLTTNGVIDVTNYRNMKDVNVSEADETSPDMRRANFEWVYKTITSTVKKNLVDQIRSEADKEKRKILKKKLGYFNIGVFKEDYRLNANLISSEFILLDFDHLVGDISEKRNKLKDKSEVYAAFISPSGNGLKIIFRLERPITDPEVFSQIYKYYAQQYGSDLGEDADHTSDVSRPCFFSYDPDMYVNQYASALKVDGIELAIPKASKGKGREELLKLFESAKEGERHTALTSIVGTMISKNIDPEFAMGLALRLDRNNGHEPLPVEEVVETVDYLYTKYSSEDILQDFWSQGKEIYQIGFAKDKFFIEKIGKDKFNIIVRDRIRKEKKRRSKNVSEDDVKKEVGQAYSRLIIEKHIKHLARVDHLGDAAADSNSYRVDLDEGAIYAGYSMLPVRLKDNKSIEEYLGRTFGEHKEFIKKYLAVYCYTNYRKLPTLILFGERGTGKSTFAEVLMDIFPAISYSWHGNEQTFTPESEKKLLIVEENNSDKASQYKTLKKYSGQKYALVHKKFKEPYMVRNNMNIIILSNETIPLYLKKEELPTNENNNQFFVMEFKPLVQEIDNTIQQSLIDRLGYYIRTELKNVFDSLEMDQYRYSIPIPITKEERDLFNSNTTEIDLDTDSLIQLISKRMQDVNFRYKPFIEKKLLPVSFINDWKSEITKSHKNSIIKNLKKRRLIDAGDAKKSQIAKQREYCYQMTDELYNMIIGEFEECM